MDITLAVLAPPSSSLRKKSNKKEFELLVNDEVNVLVPKMQSFQLH